MMDQSLGFQGMFKGKRNTEENEDNMASRLQIEMGKSLLTEHVLSNQHPRSGEGDRQ